MPFLYDHEAVRRELVLRRVLLEELKTNGKRGCVGGVSKVRIVEERDTKTERENLEHSVTPVRLELDEVATECWDT